MLVRVQHAVLSLPTGCGKGLRSRLVAALVLADPPSLREQSPESPWRLLLLDAWQSGLSGCAVIPLALAITPPQPLPEEA